MKRQLTDRLPRILIFGDGVQEFAIARITTGGFYLAVKPETLVVI